VSTSHAQRAALVPALEQALRETSAQSVLFSHAVAERAGMSAADLESLDLLIRHGPMTAGRLAELTGLTTGAVTGLVDRLERRGYARRERHPTDRRSVVVQPLTESALRDFEPSYTAMRQAIDKLFSRYSEEELNVILDFMERAAAVTAEQVGALRSQANRR